MTTFFAELTKVRKYLVNQQVAINECLATIDGLISDQISKIPNNGEGEKVTGNSELPLVFPKDISTKRDKLKYILSKTNIPMTAREIKQKLSQYGEDLPHVDQSLVNLEKDGLIKSTNENGRKNYYLEK